MVSQTLFRSFSTSSFQKRSTRKPLAFSSAPRVLSYCESACWLPSISTISLASTQTKSATYVPTGAGILSRRACGHAALATACLPLPSCRAEGSERSDVWLVGLADAALRKISSTSRSVQHPSSVSALSHRSTARGRAAGLAPSFGPHKGRREERRWRSSAAAIGSLPTKGDPS